MKTVQEQKERTERQIQINFNLFLNLISNNNKKQQQPSNTQSEKSERTKVPNNRKQSAQWIFLTLSQQLQQDIVVHRN